MYKIRKNTVTTLAQSPTACGHGYNNKRIHRFYRHFRLWSEGDSSPFGRAKPLVWNSSKNQDGIVCMEIGV